MNARLGLSLPFGALITLTLFALMVALIKIADRTPTETTSFPVPTFIQEEVDTIDEVKEELVRPEPIVEPATPDLSPLQNEAVDNQLEVFDPIIKGPDQKPGPALDGEPVPIVQVSPDYPTRALERGIEGWVVVGFTIGTTGAVESPYVIESKPKNIFDRSALKAVSRFKYKPKMVDGKAVRSNPVKTRIRFNMGK